MRAIPLCLLLALLLAPAANAATLSGGTAQRVLVGYSEGEGDTVADALKAAGATVLMRDEHLRLLVVETEDPDLAKSLPGVAFVESDDPTRLTGSQWNGAQWNGAQWNGAQWNGDPPAETGEGPTQWALEAIRAPEAWQVHQGERQAKLCVLDSGIAWDHPDLRENMWTASDGRHGKNFQDPSKSAYDDAWHGTHVAGAAAAVIGNDHGIAGAANVRLMAAKVLDANGEGLESHLALGLSWCARNGADVAVMALSVTEPGPALDRALAFAAERDVLLVASAGNDGCDACVAYPARDPRVVAVAASDETGGLASFSSDGSQVELVAPGVEILSTLPDGAFGYGSGTSQAAGIAAGVAALARDADGSQSAQQTRDSLAAARDGDRRLDAAATLG